MRNEDAAAKLPAAPRAVDAEDRNRWGRVMAVTTANASDAIDARPVRPTSKDTPWDRALELRDRFASELRATLQREKLDAAVFVSANGNFPPWVQLQAWLPGRSSSRIGAGGRERASVSFTIDAKPYHEHDVVVSAALERGKTKINAKEWPDFPLPHVSEWVLYALDRGPKPSNYTPLQDALRHFVTAMIPFVHGPHSNRLLPEYRTRFTGAMLLGLISLLLLVGGGQGLSAAANSYETPVLPLLALVLGLAGLIATAAIVRSRKRAVCVTTQSELPPRNLVLVDSWHAVVSELGRDFAAVKRRIVEALAEDASPGVSCQTETYTHRSPNGYEQRERLVVFKDQGMVHVHVYQFGHELFVGWYAYLNWAQWGETNPVGVKIRDRQEVEYRDLRPATYVPNQFDLIDPSSLSEFVHRRLEREIKALMKEKAIDQEIDFKVIRGDRDRALDEERHGGDEKASSASQKASSTSWSYQ
jgi:hypothetical protein